MKPLFLSTSSGETTKYAESLTLICGAEPGMVRYDTAEATDAAVYAACKEAAPDMIVFIGSRWGKQPSTSTLAKINGTVAPMIHLCSDAADPPWHDLLREYDQSGCFAVQVAIDGNPAWPGAERGLTLLTPIAEEHFTSTPKFHSERSIACGYAGNPGNPLGKRRTLLQELMMRNLLTMRLRADIEGSYDAYCKFLGDCRLSLNVPFTGTEATTHVKGRVIESGLAGACLLEGRGTPTAKWFNPGVDYIEFNDVSHLLELIGELSADPIRTQQIGARLRQRVRDEHAPSIFWGKVFDRIGVAVPA